MAASSLRSRARRSLRSGSAPSFRPADRGDQGRQVEIDGQLRHADRGKRVDGEEDRFGVSLGGIDADQLGADLRELPLGLQRRDAHADHVAAIGEAQGPWLMLEAGDGDTRDLDGHVRPHPHHALRNGIHQPEGLAGDRGT